MATQEKSSVIRDRDALSVEVGHWFKAHATGRGVIAIPVVVLVVAAAALLRAFVG